MSQRDVLIKEMKRTDSLLEYAVLNGNIMRVASRSIGDEYISSFRAFLHADVATDDQRFEDALMVGVLFKTVMNIDFDADDIRGSPHGRERPVHRGHGSRPQESRVSAEVDRVRRRASRAPLHDELPDASEADLKAIHG